MSCEGFELVSSTSRSKVNTWPLCGGVNCIIELIASHPRVQEVASTESYNCIQMGVFPFANSSEEAERKQIIFVPASAPGFRVSLVEGQPAFESFRSDGLKMAEPISETRCVSLFHSTLPFVRSFRLMES